MPLEPQLKRTVAFFDGQNLFHAAREAFGYTYPNYDPAALARTICSNAGWKLCQVRFYTSIPDPAVDSFWHAFWVRKLAVLGTRGSGRSLGPFATGTSADPARRHGNHRAGRPRKGVDVRLALDVVRLARAGSSTWLCSSVRTKTCPRWRTRCERSLVQRIAGSRPPALPQ